MRPFIIAILVLLFARTGLAQTRQVTYFNKNWKELPSSEKARYSRTVTTTPDGITVTEERDLKKDRLLLREEFKGDEPWGERTYGNTVADYSFPLIYDEAVCADSIAGLRNYFTDDSTHRYTAPVMAEDKSLYAFLNRTMRYPDREREAGNSGKVYTAFTISASGLVSDVHVTKSSGSVGLDKEAVRVIRLLRFTSGPKQDGKFRSVCARQTLTFKID